MTTAHSASGRNALYDWFAASAATHADRTALELGEHSLTYGQLTALFDHMAATVLDRVGGRRPDRVGLVAGRTVAAYAGYLAIQRLGATAVPMGATHPAARNTRIAVAAGVDIVLADESTGELPDLDAPAERFTDAELIGTSRGLAAFPRPAATPESLAYILFTSGSTGAPKGVPIRHRNVCSYLQHVVPARGAGPGDRVSQTFDLTFDPSVYDMFTAWGTGATLVVPTRGEVLSPVRFVTRRAITHWNSVPSVISLAQRLRSLKPRSMPALRHSMFCGEPLTMQQALWWHGAAPDSRVENAYGPTELTVTCTAYQLPAAPEEWPETANGTVPIGRVHPGMEYRVIDDELCVRGPQRFPGYLDPVENAGRFLAPGGTPIVPGGKPAPEHWYRTGDRIADESAGLVHLGRMDQQVQLHGFRVELGEIEAALRTVPGVCEAVVLTVPSVAGQELAAAYTRDQNEDRDAAPASVHEALAARLPRYMIPATLTPLGALPLNPNGKVDRRAVGAVLAAEVGPA